MNWGLYKPGQGYWIRVLTAAFIGVWFLAGAAWAFKELANAPIPYGKWNVAVEHATGAPAPGAAVEFYAHPEAAAAPPKIGTATVVSQEKQGAGLLVVVNDARFDPDRDPARAGSVRSPDGAFQADVRTASGVPVVEPLYVQTIGVAVVVLIGVLLTYRFVGASPRTSDFLIATDGEMKKVNWSTRKDILGSTWVVIAWTFLLAACLFTVDIVFRTVFTWFGVLERLG